MIIQIRKSEIFAEAEKASAYIGKKSNKFDLISLTTAEHEAIEQSYSSGCNIIIDTLKDFIVNVKPVVDNGGGIDVELKCPHIDKFGDSTASSITSSINLFLAHHIGANWLRICVEENGAKEFDAKANIALGTTRRLIYYRKKIRYEED